MTGAGVLLCVIGTLSWVYGFVVFAGAASILQQIAGILLFLNGSVLVVGGALLAGIGETARRTNASWAPARWFFKRQKTRITAREKARENAASAPVGPPPLPVPASPTGWLRRAYGSAPELLVAAVLAIIVGVVTWFAAR